MSEITLTKNQQNHLPVVFRNWQDVSKVNSAWAWSGFTNKSITAWAVDGAGVPTSVSLTNTPSTSAIRFITLTQAECNHDALYILIRADEIDPVEICVRFVSA